MKSELLTACSIKVQCGARGSAVGWDAVLHVGRPQVRFPLRSPTDKSRFEENYHLGYDTLQFGRNLLAFLRNVLPASWEPETTSSKKTGSQQAFCLFTLYRVFQKELYNFESLYKFIQRTYIVFLTVVMLWFNVTSTANAGCLKKALQWYSKCCRVASYENVYT
jgi:hypothetical protein